MRRRREVAEQPEPVRQRKDTIPPVDEIEQDRRAVLCGDVDHRTHNLKRPNAVNMGKVASVGRTTLDRLERMVLRKIARDFFARDDGER